MRSIAHSFLLLGSLLAATLLPGAQADLSQCSRVTVRKEIRTLTVAERTTYIRAIRQIQQGPRPNIYDRYTYRHWNAGNWTHGFAQLLPWHRAFVYEFEQDLQRIDKNIGVPFWDWSYDSQAPELSPVWKPEFFGGNGVLNPADNTACVRDGPFVDWRTFYPEQRCFQRSWDNANSISAYYSPEMLQLVSNNAETYDQFRQRIEAPAHNQVHVSIGGDFPTHYSPNEPLFWSHHSFIDKLWYDWQRQRPGRINEYNGKNANATQALLTDQLEQLRYPVSDMMDSDRLCYTYEPAPWESAINSSNGQGQQSHRRRALVDLRRRDNEYTFTPIHAPQRDNRTGYAPPAGDRSELLELRVPPPLPEAHILRNRLDVAQVRHHEAVLRETAYALNRLPTYVSPVALVNRPDLLERLADQPARAITSSGNQRDTLSPFTATENERQMEVHVQRGTHLSQEILQRMTTQIKQIYQSTSTSGNKADDTDLSATNRGAALENIIGAGAWNRYGQQLV